MIAPEGLISNLLLRHSCVIVPGFGGFVAQRTPATLDLDKGIMLPPGKSLLFNRQLINNDGLLTNALAANHSISYDHAKAMILSMVGEWNKQLAKGARVQIDKVGYLFYDREKNLCFEQDRFFNLLLESFGLGKVHFTLEKEAAKVIDLRPHLSDGFPEIATTHPKRPVWKYLAAACIIPLAFYSFWIPTKTNVLQSGMFSVKDFDPFFKQAPGLYAKVEIPNLEFKSLINHSLDIHDSYEFMPGMSFPVREELEAECMIDLSKKHSLKEDVAYQFIVGCFKSPQNTNLMISKLRSAGIEAYVYDTVNGLQRVSAGGAMQEEALHEVRKKLFALGITGWIYRSK